MRMARIGSRLDLGHELESLDPELNLAASLTLVGSPGVAMCLITGAPFARRLAFGIASDRGAAAFVLNEG